MSSDMPTDPTSDEIDHDPFADESGRIGAIFEHEVGGEIAALLADPTMWEHPSSHLVDDVVDAIRSEAGTGPRTLARPVSSGAHARFGRFDGADRSDHDITGDQPSRGAVSSVRFARLRPALLGAAAAVAVLLGGILAFSALSGAPQQEDFAIELIPTGELPDVDGKVEVTSTQSGLRIDLDAASLPRRAGGQFYEGWLRLDDGRLVPIGTFHDGDGVILWAGIELDEVAGLTITLEEAVAADSAEQASSGRVVLKADFPER